MEHTYITTMPTSVSRARSHMGIQINKGLKRCTWTDCLNTSVGCFKAMTAEMWKRSHSEHNITWTGFVEKIDIEAHLICAVF